jgi:hypothetical protein
MGRKILQGMTIDQIAIAISQSYTRTQWWDLVEWVKVDALHVAMFGHEPEKWREYFALRYDAN